MSALTLDLPPGLMERLARSPEQAARRIKMELALNLYSQGMLSHFQACQLAGMTRHEFEDLCCQRQVIRPYTVEMLEEDLRNVGGDR